MISHSSFELFEPEDYPNNTVDDINYLNDFLKELMEGMVKKGLDYFDYSEEGLEDLDKIVEDWGFQDLCFCIRLEDGVYMPYDFDKYLGSKSCEMEEGWHQLENKIGRSEFESSYF